MLSHLAKLIFRMAGWHVEMTTERLPKCVICIAPHTSNWDFIIGHLVYMAIYKDQRPHFLMKKEWFVFPLKYLFKAMGGIPVDRSRHSSLTEQLAIEISKHKIFRMALTPEGTRKPVKEWKKGFYYMAKGAGVPLQLAFIDGERKTAGIALTLNLSDNEADDLGKIKKFYSTVSPLKKGNFCLPENF